jgi:hypothetical protein
MDERKEQGKLAKVIRDYGWLAEPFNDKRTIGWPDLFVGGPSLGMWLECKVLLPSGKLKHPLSGEQFSTLQKLHKRPLPAGVCLFFADHSGVMLAVPINQWDRVLSFGYKTLLGYAGPLGPRTILFNFKDFDAGRY